MLGIIWYRRVTPPTDHLYAQGGSTGGLLIGAVINMAPDLFNGAIAAVPFVDVVSTMLDETIPLTTFEFENGKSKKQRILPTISSRTPLMTMSKKRTTLTY